LRIEIIRPVGDGATAHSTSISTRTSTESSRLPSLSRRPQ
jgi:hypothetical protein